MIRADRFISEKPQEAYAMVAQHLQLDPSVVAGFCEEIDYEIRITPRLLGMIEFETEWLPQYLPTFYSGKKPVTSDFAALVADNLKTLVPAAYQLKK
jgi:hypothetical protein